MGFEFRLERLMNVAESEKHSLEVEYQRLFARFETLARRLMDLLKEKKSMEIELDHFLKQSVTVGAMRRRTAGVEGVRRQIAEQTRRYDKARCQLEAYRKILQEKTVEVKKYEKLKEKQHHLYRISERKKEMKRLDEIAAYQVGRAIKMDKGAGESWKRSDQVTER
ncbi:flagellar export protein FliJ [Sporolactobacillus sp. THM7-7]|nr:flagellar export protein FliJ [Sporolactobacillus sp. THM7-7]